jgi:crotonobetainyl-CoA:carnitine CoA-transferase CaiB-like acyl-CoA transferase
MGDTGNALLAAAAITAALYHRERTGNGQAVSTSIVNAGLLHTSYAWIHEDGTPGGWSHVDGDQYGLSPYHRMFRCADDRWVFVVAADEGARSRLLSLAGEAGAVGLDDPAKVAALLEDRFLGDDAASWSAALDRARVPAEIVDETFCRTLFDDPEARSRRLVSQTWAGGVGRFEDPGILVDLSEMPAAVQRGPSRCGEHTRELLLEYGYTDAEADALAADRAVLDAPIERS